MPPRRQDPQVPVLKPQTSTESGKEERLQKVLAAAGVASRRACEKLIVSGRVKVNGKVVRELGTKVDPDQVMLHVDGQLVMIDDSRVTIALNKPTGVESSLRGDPHDLTQFLTDYRERLFHVGRLDVDTSGLLLLTNDGELANRLTHPSWEVPKTYLATVKGKFTGKTAQQLRSGIMLEDGFAQADRVSIRGNHGGLTLVEIELHLGRNRIVRRMFEEVGAPVMELSRIAHGTVKLGTLPLGATRRLSKPELSVLMKSVDL
ncbi:pseudouridine synthase [Varibaculum massiliense]